MKGQANYPSKAPDLAVRMFTSWQVRCGIASYAADLVAALRGLPATQVDIVAYDRRRHPRRDYVAWGEAMNAGDVAHIQHEYSFFGYLVPWQNHYDAFVTRIRRPLVITRHVTFDGPLTVPGSGLHHFVRRAKWAAYNRWLGPYATYLNKGTFAHADRLIVLSARLKEHMVARGLAADKIHVIPAGVPQVAPAAGGEALRATWGWQEMRVLGIFGYITPAKGYRLAVEALAGLPADFVLLVAGGVRRAGDQVALDELERDIAAAGLGARVRITGFLEEKDVPAHIAACDLLLYPATHADSSYSLVTGLAYGCAPVVASDVYGHREVAARKAGVALFASGDAAALAQLVQEVLQNPAQRAALLEEAAAYAKTHAWPAIAAQTRQVYVQAATDWQQKQANRGSA
jgi:glycosyltransferase involved in cell wall biosynthesis